MPRTSRSNKPYISFSHRLLILVALAESENHGTGIMDRIRKKTDGKVIVPYGSLYPLLDSMSAEGIIKFERTMPCERKAKQGSGGGRPFNVFSITDRGRDALQEYIRLSSVLLANLKTD